MPSADGKGRTLLEILTGRNKKDMRPLEFQYHNPLEAKVGCTVSFDHEPDIAGINFVIEKIGVYKTEINRKEFFHTDYHLKGTSLDTEGFIRMRLRLIPDENATDQLAHRIQILYLYTEMGWSEEFYNNVLCVDEEAQENNPDGEFYVDNNDEGEPLVQRDDEGNPILDEETQEPIPDPRTYWRIEGILDPYNARMTELVDVDGDGTVEDDELEHSNVMYWEYSRITDDPSTGDDMTEYLTVEMDRDTRYFTFLRGTDIEAFQVSVF